MFDYYLIIFVLCKICTYVLPISYTVHLLLIQVYMLTSDDEKIEKVYAGIEKLKKLM